VTGKLLTHWFPISTFSYSPNGVEAPPRWTCVLCALGLFIYQSLDSIDGKQARRTNTSSPLGELFDHGCDSISTVFVALSACISCQLGHYPNWLFFQVSGLRKAYLERDKFWTSLSVLLCYSSLLLRPLADLCVRNDALRTNWCDGGAVFNHSHSPGVGCAGPWDLAEQGRRGSEGTQRGPSSNLLFKALFPEVLCIPFYFLFIYLSVLLRVLFRYVYLEFSVRVSYRLLRIKLG